MNASKARVIGVLGVTISSAHKFLRVLKQARKHDNLLDWSTLGKRLDELEDLYRRARNACEHLDERIYRGEYTSDEHFSFSIDNKLRFVDPKKGPLILNFSPRSLAEIADIWATVHKMLDAADTAGRCR